MYFWDEFEFFESNSNNWISDISIIGLYVHGCWSTTVVDWVNDNVKRDNNNNKR